MKAEDLRKSILQKAIQGQLLPQNSEDEDASLLFKRIQKEKEQLIKDKIIKKEKPLAPITEEEKPFDLPKGWIWCRLGEVAEIYTGNSIAENIKKTRYSNLLDGYNYIGTKDVEFNHVINYINGVKIPKTEEKFRYAYENDILLCIEGGSAGRKIGILSEKVCFGNKLCCFHQFINTSNFLYYLMQSSYFFDIFKDNISGIIGGVSTTKIKSLSFPLPPLEEQKRIVAKIEELMPLCDEFERLEKEDIALDKAFFDHLPKSILQKAIQGQLVPQNSEDEDASLLFKRIQKEKEQLIKDKKIKKEKLLAPITEEEKPFDLPKGWIWCRLGEVMRFVNGDRGKNYPSKDKLNISGEYSFISAINLKNYEINTNNLLYLTKEQYNLLSSGKIEKKDIIFCIRGSIGKFAVSNSDKGAIASSLVLLKSYYNDFYIEYLVSYLKSPMITFEIQKYLNGTAQPNLSAENLANFLIPLPPLEEQKRIVAKVDELMQVCEEFGKNKND